MIFVPPPPTFYKDVLPIVQRHCQTCHRPGEIGPMPLVTYDEVRQWRTEIAQKATARMMPPWFADPNIGKFANDPSLTPAEIATLQHWSAAGGPAGSKADAPPPPTWAAEWNIPAPTNTFRMPQAVEIPARGDVAYTYEIVPTGFTHDTWVRMSEIRPTARDHVHHAVVYVRPPGSSWLRGAPIGRAFTASSLGIGRAAVWTDSDILLVYAPGSSPDAWPADMGKCIPAGSDLVFQMHYTTNGHAASDRTAIGLVTDLQPPPQRVLTLQLTNDQFIIPPGVDDYRVEAHGTLPNDATLLSFFPHMHLRGKRFEYNIVPPHAAPGVVIPLLRVNYNFFWQLSYRLAQPMRLTAGTELQAVGWYDNSKGNPHNPDPDAAVHWGDQTDDEMMVGFFDIAVPASVDKAHYFLRTGAP